MIGKFIGATVGRRVARSVGTKVGGPAGAAIGYGLVSRRFRKFALAGLAVTGGVAAVRALKEGRPISSLWKDEEATAEQAGTDTNKDPLPAYAPHS